MTLPLLPPRAARAAMVVAALALHGLPVAAQQFVHQVGMIPGTPRWSEGLECADVDLDGDLDLFVADGDGFSSPATKRQNVLLVNRLIELGSLSFADESVARLGAHVSHAKGVTTADVDGDGWVDALFSNAFNTDVPFLYVNRGTAAPGFFTLESAARGLTTVLAAGGAMFADLDDDGDLDLIVNGNYLGSGSGKPRLYFNDGGGVFTENAAALNAASKSAHMDVQLVDIDGDWDVDFLGVNRATNAGGNHYLMLNQGAGTFTDASALLPATSANCYEAEVGDLDGDLDIDLFFVSLSGFAEGAVRNNLVPAGPLGFTGMGSFGGDDDNEIALLDRDMDGDRDVFVGSLGAREKLYRNDGNFTFVDQSVQITAVSDSTLDLTIADLDNDGRYDLITAQGESGSAQWANKVYLNNGAVDTLPPAITAVRSPAFASPSGPVVVHARVRDQVLDDGVDYVTGLARYVVVTAPQSVQVSITAGGFSPPAVNLPAGASAVWTNNTATPRTVTSTTAPYAFDVTIPPGGTHERAFVNPLVYGYTDTSSGNTGQVTVTGAPATVAGLKAGIQQHRFSMPDTAAGAGVLLVYELSFRDWPGNVRVGEPGRVPLLDCGTSTYCTAKVTSGGCVPLMASTGTPSATAGAFHVLASRVEPFQLGVLFRGTSGPLAQPFQGGFLCVAPPVVRLAPQGSGGAGACSGTYSVDFGAHIQGGGDAAMVAGAQVWVQFWFRDPGAFTGTGLSGGLTFTICP